MPPRAPVGEPGGTGVAAVTVTLVDGGTQTMTRLIW